LVSASKIL
jgi:hypothetical protein